MPGLSQALFGEGSNLTAAQEASIQDKMNASGEGRAIFGTGDNASGPQGNGKVNANNLAGNEVSASTPSVNSGLYANAINLANAQTQNYRDMGNAALSTAAPTINNPASAQSLGNIQATGHQYLGLDTSLASTIRGAGPNAGQAQFSGALGNNIASQMAAAHAGKGGYSLGGALSAGQAGAGTNLQAAQQAAAARGQQITQAQAGLGGALNAQGGMNMETYNLQNQNALNQAQMQEAQNGINNTQAMNLYGLSQAQQAAAANDLQQFNTQAISTENAGTAHQNTLNQQLGTIIGAGGQAVGGIAATVL